MATLNPNSTNCAAYTSSCTDKTSPDSLSTILTAATGYSGAQLNTVSVDDTNFVSTSGSSACHLVKYRVTGSESQLDFTMKAQDSGPAESTLYMYVWNANSTAWELLTTAAPAAIRTLAGSKTTSISNYIDGSNDVHTLIAAGNSSSHTFSLYYSELVTTVVSSSSSSNSSSSNSSSSNSSSSNSSSSNSSGSNSSSSSDSSSSNSSSSSSASNYSIYSGLQIALGGYEKLPSIYDSSIVGKETFFDSPNQYFEPIFNIENQIQFNCVDSDYAYVLIRRRLNSSETSFTDLSVSDIKVEAYDLTNRSKINHKIYDILDAPSNSDWSSNTFDPIIIRLKLETGGHISSEYSYFNNRIISVKVTHKDSKETISFKVKNVNSQKIFSYLSVDNKLFNRPSQSVRGFNARVEISSIGSYMIFTPNSIIEEVSKTETFDFSYPYNTIFYKRNALTNDENFDFSIEGTSDSFLLDNVKLYSISNYKKVGVLLFSAYIQTLFDNSDKSIFYVDILARGHTSNQEDTYRVYLFKKDNSPLLLSY